MQNDDKPHQTDTAKIALSPDRHGVRPSGWLILALTTVAALVVSQLIIHLQVQDSLLIAFTVPCIVAAFFYPRAIYMAMIALVMGLAWHATGRVSPDPQSSRVTIIIAGLSSAFAAETVHALVGARRRLQQAQQTQALADSVLADVGSRLIACRTRDEAFTTLETFLSRLNLDALILLNEATADQRTLVTRAVFGISPALLAKAEKLVGFRIIGKRSSIVDRYHDLFFQHRLQPVPGGFADLARSEIPVALGKVAEALLGLHRVYTIGIADAGVIYGNIHFTGLAPDVVFPIYTIESVVYQCFITLSRIDAAGQLAASEEKYRLLFHNMNAGFALHELIRDETGQGVDYRFLEVNAAFEEMTGWQAEDVIGHTILEVQPETEPEWIQVYAQVVDTGHAAKLTSFSAPLDRIYDIVAYRTAPDRFATVFHDVTARWQAEAALRDARDDLERRVVARTSELQARTSELQAQYAQADAILRSVDDAIFLANADRTIEYVNPAFTRLSGYASAEIVGHSIERLADVLGSDETCHVVLMHLAQEESWHGDVVCRRRDGTPFDAALTAVMIREADDVSGYVFSLQDISTRKRLIRARNQFITNVSHQFRTPVTTLSLRTHLLLRKELPPDVQDSLRAMEAQIDWLSQLIQDTLTLATLDSGKGLHTSTAVSLPTVIEAAVSGHQSAAEAKGLALTVAPLPPDPPVVLGDSARLVEALKRLLSNAVRYTAKGSVHVCVSVTHEPPPALRTPAAWIAIAVRDTGAGIPADEVDQVFERFFRGRIAGAGDTNGTGLGLNIARQIARAHGGDITFETEVGAGSTFTLWIPARAA